MRQDIKLFLAHLWVEFRKNRGMLGPSSTNYKYHVPILCYHSVSPQSTERGFRISPENFEDQIHYLVSNYNVISLSEFIGRVSGKQNLKDAAVVTFDDGYRDNYIYAYPILKKYNCPATIFLPTAFIEGDVRLIEDEVLEPLKWSEIIKMRMSGRISFGSHGHTHRILSKIQYDEVNREINISKDIIEDRLGEKINLFAYPNGQLSDFNHETIDILKKNNFISACSTVWSISNSQDNLFFLNRIIIDPKDNLKIFKLKLSAAYDYLYYVHKMKYFLKNFLDNLFRSFK